MPKANQPGLLKQAPKVDAKNKGNKKGKGKEPKQFGYAPLNKDQEQVINNINQADIGLSGYNNQQLPGVYGAYSQPFDQSQLPTSPWAQGQTIQDMEGQYYDRALENYDRSMAKDYQQADLDFEEMAAQRGWTPGSKVYEKEKTRIADQRAGAKQNAMDSAYFNAGQNASNWNNIATGNFQNAYGFQQDMRNMPASEFAKIQGLQSGMPGQNLGFNQAWQLQQDDQAMQKYIFDHTPKGGAGGGGGGGSQPIWAQYGLAGPAEYDAYKQNIAREQAQWQWANDPQYRQQKQANPWASLGGQALGIGAGLGFGSLFS